MKKVTLLLALFTAALMTNAQVMVESFDYTAGTTLTSNGWSAHSAAGTNPITVDAMSLTFPQYSPTSVGGSALSAGNSEDVNAYFGPISSGNIYASFLVRVDSIGTAGYFFHFQDSLITSAYRARTYFQQDADNPNAFNLGLTFNSSTGVFDTTEFALGSTILIVAKYSIYNGLDNDSVSLYAFTSGSSIATEPAMPLLGPVGGTATDIDPARIALRQFNSNTGYAVDAFSIDTVWNMSPAFVMPTTPLDLPITFDDSNVDYDLVSFGDAIDSIVVDPTNPSNMVLRQDKPAGAQTWAGTVCGDGGLANNIPFTATHHFMTARVWAADSGTAVLMKVEDVANGAVSVETFAYTTVAGAWETLTFDFTANAPGTPAIDYNASYGKVVVFGDFGTAGSGKTFYFDDIEFSASGVGVEENQWINDFAVLPNPNNGNFTINGSLLGVNEVEITVTDIQGRTIYRSTERASMLNKELHLDGVSSGMYILRVSSQNGTVTDKILVRR